MSLKFRPYQGKHQETENVRKKSKSTKETGSQQPPKRMRKSLGKQIGNITPQNPFRRRKPRTGGFKDFMKKVKTMIANLAGG